MSNPAEPTQQQLSAAERARGWDHLWRILLAPEPLRSNVIPFDRESSKPEDAK